MAVITVKIPIHNCQTSVNVLFSSSFSPFGSFTIFVNWMWKLIHKAKIAATCCSRPRRKNCSLIILTLGHSHLASIEAGSMYLLDALMCWYRTFLPYLSMIIKLHNTDLNSLSMTRLHLLLITPRDGSAPHTLKAGCLSGGVQKQ